MTFGFKPSFAKKGKIINVILFILNKCYNLFKFVFKGIRFFFSGIINLFRKKEETIVKPSYVVVQNDSFFKKYFKIKLWQLICDFISMTKREKIFLTLALSGIIFTVYSVCISYNAIGITNKFKYNNDEMNKALLTFDDKLEEYQKKNKSLEREIKKQAVLLETAKKEKIRLIRQIEKKNPRKIGKPNTLARCNNNPLNVKCLVNGGKWKGEIGRDKFNHVIFETPEHGIRAASFVLLTYYRKHNIKTINKLVRRFSTNNHKPYANFLSKELGIGKDEEFNFIKFMPKLLAAMSQYESGCKIDESYIVNLDIVTKL